MASHGDRDNSVPLEAIVELIESGIGSITREPDGVSFDGAIGITHIRVRPIDVDAIDRAKITNVISIVTELPELPIPSDDAALAVCNTGAAFSAAIRNEETKRIELVSRLSCFENDDEAWRLYVPMVAFAAMFQSDIFLKFLSQLLSSSGIEVEGEFAGGDEPPPWGAEDFQLTQERLDQIGIFANGGEGGLTAEFPWDAGAVSQMESLITGGERKRTSLLLLKTEESHPYLGNGLFCRLVLPISYPFERAAEVVHQLNRLERAATDAPPFFGAWCAEPSSGTPTFVCFWPNAFYAPGTATNITTWMMHRSRIAKTWVDDDQGKRW